MSEDIHKAFRIGLASARANVVPMVVLWSLAGALVTGYYTVSGVAEALEPLKRWQTERGWVASFLNMFLFCGALPGVFLLVQKSLRVRHPFLMIAVQSVWSGVCGIVSGWMYDLNAHWFGTGLDFRTLTAKTAVAQFLWTPFFFVPIASLVYFWIGRDFSIRRCRNEPKAEFLWSNVSSTLIANWAIWIPCTMLVVMLPTALQVQVSGIVNAFLFLVQLRIGRCAGTRSMCERVRIKTTCWH